MLQRLQSIFNFATGVHEFVSWGGVMTAVSKKVGLSFVVKFGLHPLELGATSQQGFPPRLRTAKSKCGIDLCGLARCLTSRLPRNGP